MTDVFTVEKRSEVMRAIKGKDTAPEMVVRRLVHGMGYRYRLHQKGLPGKPDLVFAGRSKVIFVHGCFWHGHDACRGGHLPKSNGEYWSNKIEGNRCRDKHSVRTLRSMGWKVMTIWECQTARPTPLATAISRFLERE